MLRILTPRTDSSEHARKYQYSMAQSQPANSADIHAQSRPISMGSDVTCASNSMVPKSSSPLTSASASQVPTQTATITSNQSTSRVPRRPNSVFEFAIERNPDISVVRSLSISKPIVNSIASSRAAATCCPTDARPRDYDIPRLTKTPWEIERNKKTSTLRRSGPAQLPARIFKMLPKEVYECIITHLEHIHLRQNQTCPSCYLRDLYSLSLTNRAWDRVATPHMYRRVYLIGRETHLPSLKLKVKRPSRLKLLRRTLRDRIHLARHVRELHLSDFQMLYQHASIEREEIVNLIASLVMACPSLERLIGFHIPLTQSYDRLSYALATRSKLKERVWLLSAFEDDYLDEEDNDQIDSSYYLTARDPTERFLQLNSGHPLLTTLVLHRSFDEPGPALNFRAIIGTFRQLPMLQHLSISGLPATSFTNLTLNALPPRLRALRLENLSGINDKGLQRFVTSHLSTSIEKLTLINLELSDLTTVTKILSEHLSKLRYFAIVQYRTPDLNQRTSIPNFCSPSLQFIHLEFRSQSGPAIDPFSPNPRKSIEFPFTNSEPISCLAISLLAMNIKEGALPVLRRVRIPHDPQGVIQALCQPLATALLPTDTSPFTRPFHKTGSNNLGSVIDGHTSHRQSPTSRDSSVNLPPSPRADSAIDSSLHETAMSSSVLTPAKSRLAAQARILAARKAPFMNVRVFDPEGRVRIDTDIGGFLGDIKSNIIYDLKPDKSRWPGNRDQSGSPQPEWITGIEDLVDERTPATDRSHERFWGNCGHFVGGRIGHDTVRVEELF